MSIINFFLSSLGFFIIAILTLSFTVFLYIRLVVAVREGRDVPKWMYKVGHAIKGRGSDIYEDVTDKAALNEVNIYIVGILVASIFVYFIFSDKYFMNDRVLFWTYAEFAIVVGLGMVIGLASLLLDIVLPSKGKWAYNLSLSSAANAVKGMIFMSAFVCALVLNITGLPEKAPVVQVDGYTLVVGQTTAQDLLDEGFSFSGKTENDIIENKRNDHFYYGETVGLVKDGKSCGYVNLTPVREDEGRVKDCIITRFGISSRDAMFDRVKIDDRYIASLSLDELKKKDMKAVFSLSPVSYEENKGNKYFSLKMQTHPYGLWNRYTIETEFSGDNREHRFEVYTQHTIWE